MEALDILFVTISIAVIITTVMINMILYNIWQTLKSIRLTSERALRMTSQIINLKQKAKLAVLRPFHGLINKFRKQNSSN